MKLKLDFSLKKITGKVREASPLFCLLWSAVDHPKQGILAWVLGDHSAKTFEPLWAVIATWKCYFGSHGWMVSLSLLYS